MARPRQILLIHGDLGYAVMLRHCLEIAGFEVRLAHPSDKIAAGQDSDLALLDLGGQESAMQARLALALRCQAPLIALIERQPPPGLRARLKLAKARLLPRHMAPEQLVIELHASLAADRHAPRRLRYLDLELSLDSMTVRRGNRLVRLGPIGFRLLSCLMREPARVFDRRELAEAAWPGPGDPSRRRLDVQIGRLRRALNRPGEASLIANIHGVGYALVTEDIKKSNT